MNQPEKASERVMIRVTPTDLAKWKQASGGNVSQFVKQAANAQVTKQVYKKR